MSNRGRDGDRRRSDGGFEGYARRGRGPPRGPFRGGPRNYPPGPYFEGPMRPPRSWFPEMGMGPEEYYPEEYYEEPYEEFMEEPSYFGPPHGMYPRGRGRGSGFAAPRGPPVTPLLGMEAEVEERNPWELDKLRPGYEDFSFLFTDHCQTERNLPDLLVKKFETLVSQLKEETSIRRFEESLRALKLQGMALFYLKDQVATCRLHVHGVLAGIGKTTRREDVEGEGAAYLKAVELLNPELKEADANGDGELSLEPFYNGIHRLNAESFVDCTGVAVMGHVVPKGKDGEVVRPTRIPDADLETLKPRIGLNLILLYTTENGDKMAQKGRGTILLQSAAFSNLSLRYGFERTRQRGFNEVSCSVFIDGHLISTRSGINAKEAQDQVNQAAYERLFKTNAALKVTLKEETCMVVTRETPSVTVSKNCWLRWTRLGKVQSKFFDYKVAPSTAEEIASFTAEIEGQLQTWLSEKSDQPALFKMFGLHERIFIQDEVRKLTGAVATSIIHDGKAAVAVFLLGKAPFEFTIDCWNRGPVEGSLFNAYLPALPVPRFILVQPLTLTKDEQLLRASSLYSSNEFRFNTYTQDEHFISSVFIDKKTIATAMSVVSLAEAEERAMRMAVERLRAYCYVVKRKEGSGLVELRLTRADLFQGQEPPPLSTEDKVPSETGGALEKAIFSALDGMKLDESITLDGLTKSEVKFIVSRIDETKRKVRCHTRTATEIIITVLLSPTERLCSMVEQGIIEDSYCRITKPILTRGVMKPSDWREYFDNKPKDVSKTDKVLRDTSDAGANDKEQQADDSKQKNDVVEEEVEEGGKEGELSMETETEDGDAAEKDGEGDSSGDRGNGENEGETTGETILEDDDESLQRGTKRPRSSSGAEQDTKRST